MVDPDHIRIAYDGVAYCIERKVLTTGPDVFSREQDTITTKWMHLYGHMKEDGLWTKELAPDENNPALFIRGCYFKKEEALISVRDLCTLITYFDVNGNNIEDRVEFPKQSPYIMDERAKRYCQERSKRLEELYGKGYKDKRT